MERFILAEVPQTKRKIQYVAGSTYVVSLPKEWVSTTLGKDPKQVKKNILIIIPMQDGPLTIYPESGRDPAQSKTTLRLDEELIRSVSFFKKRLISKYLAGYNRIRLTSHRVIPPETVKVAEEIVQRFIGCEIIERTPNIIVIQDLLALGELPIVQALGMMSRIARSVIKAALHALVKQDESMAKNVAHLGDKIKQYHYLITRQLKSVLASPGLLAEHELKLGEVIVFHSVAQLIKQISNHAEGVVNEFLAMRTLPNFETIARGSGFVQMRSILKEFNTKLTGISKNAMEVFFAGDMDGAYETIQSCSALQPPLATLEQLSYDLPWDFTLKFVAIRNSISGMVDYLVAICEITMVRAELS